VAQRQAKLTKVAFGQIGQNLGINFALAKRSLILTESERAQPSPEVHDCIRSVGSMMGLREVHLQGSVSDGRCGAESGLCRRAFRDGRGAGCGRAASASDGANPSKAVLPGSSKQ
jgi:hypothetical protein